MQESNIRSRTGVRSNSGIQSIYSNIAKEFNLPITPDSIAPITPESAIPELTSIENPMSTGIDPEPTSLRKVDAPPPLRIIPPLNFCPVERQLYRSGQPSVINQSFLKDLHLKTILWLASEEPQDDFLEFCTESNINIEFVGMYNEFHNYQAYSHAASLNPWDSLDESTIKRSLELIANRENYPLLVCCGMGRHRTGTIIGCLRRLQGWNLASVSEEYRRFTGSRGGRILVELLIEGFDINSVNIDPSKIPDWL